MARMINSGMDTVLEMFQDLDFKCPEIFEKAVETGANMMIEPIKSASRGVFKNTLNLDQHLKATKPYRTSGGVVGAKVQYSGYMPNGVAVPVVVQAREFGTKNGEKKMPFIRPTVAKMQKSVMSKMQEVVDQEVGKIAKQ